jgi:hypothetical protein
MRLLKIAGGVIATLLFLSAGTVLGASLLIYGSLGDLSADFKVVKQRIKMELFIRGYVEEISPDDVRHIYEKSCYRKCHGEAAMITAVLGPAGWIQVVERMRAKENVVFSGREADMIIKHLEQKYPKVQSRYPYTVRKEVHKAVWRSDYGHGDIYNDIVYVTPEYLRSIGAEHLNKEYDLENYHTFLVGFTAHDGVVKLFDLDKIVFMRSAGREISPSLPWELRFQTSDKHHYEAMTRFVKKGGNPIVNSDTKQFELVLRDVGGPEDRVFKWSLPIVYPSEMAE